MRMASGAVFAALALAGPADAQMTPNSPELVAVAAADCWQAASGPKLDEALLQSRGWKAGSMKDPDGKSIASPLRFYGKSGSSVLLMAMNVSGAAGCTILSRVPKVADIGTAAQLLMSRLQAIDPAVKGSRQGQSIVYVSGSRAAELAPAGTMEKPSARIVVVHSSLEKK